MVLFVNTDPVLMFILCLTRKAAAFDEHDCKI